MPDASISGHRVMLDLTRLIASDNGTELSSNAVPAWCGQIGVEWHDIAVGKPMQNGSELHAPGVLRSRLFKTDYPSGREIRLV